VNIVTQVVRDRTAYNALRQGGADSTGRVTRTWRPAGKFSGWYVRYTFAVDGIVLSGESTLPQETWHGLRPGDSLRILYLPSDPNINRPAAWEGATPSDLWILVFPAGMALFGLVLIGKIPLQRRLAVEGVAARGRIDDWHRRSRGGFVLDYTFKTRDSDETVTGSCRGDRSRQVGSEVWVLYLPSDPRRSEIYPFNADFFRIEG
jgi:hypothetical protein